MVWETKKIYRFLGPWECGLIPTTKETPSKQAHKLLEALKSIQRRSNSGFQIQLHRTPESELQWLEVGLKYFFAFSLFQIHAFFNRLILYVYVHELLAETIKFTLWSESFRLHTYGFCSMNMHELLDLEIYRINIWYQSNVPLPCRLFVV